MRSTSTPSRRWDASRASLRPATSISERRKAYVTQIWDPRIYIVNPKTYQITGYVETDMDFETGSTEQMVQYDKYVFTNCWSYQNRILVIDTETDKVCDQITVGIQPTRWSWTSTTRSGR